MYCPLGLQTPGFSRFLVPDLYLGPILGWLSVPELPALFLGQKLRFWAGLKTLTALQLPVRETRAQLGKIPQNSRAHLKGSLILVSLGLPFHTGGSDTSLTRVRVAIVVGS